MEIIDTIRSYSFYFTIYAFLLIGSVATIIVTLLNYNQCELNSYLWLLINAGYFIMSSSLLMIFFKWRASFNFCTSNLVLIICAQNLVLALFPINNLVTNQCCNDSIYAMTIINSGFYLFLYGCILVYTFVKNN